MARLLLNLLIVIVLAIVGILTVFIIGMRQKSPAVIDAVRRLNKGFSNPKQMATAGTPGAYASIVEHVGRKSGNAYETPIRTEPTDDGFLIGTGDDSSSGNLTDRFSQLCTGA